MQFTTVKSYEKEYDIYLNSEKLVHSQQEHEKNVSQLFGSGKHWFLAISSLKNTVTAISREKKGESLLFGDQKMQFTTVRSKEKDYDIYLKSEKLFHSQQEHEKMFPSYLEVEKLVPSSFEPDKHCCSSLEREKSGSLLFGDQKMQFTTVKRMEKDYDIYLKSEKLVHCQQEHEKMFPSQLRSGKNWFLGLSSLTNTAAAIWREKKEYPCYLETKKFDSQLLGARKKSMISI